jgi:hypothetical protein
MGRHVCGGIGSRKRRLPRGVAAGGERDQRVYASAICCTEAGRGAPGWAIREWSGLSRIWRDWRMSYGARTMIFSICKKCKPAWPSPQISRRSIRKREYAARIGHCRLCPLREQCQESATTIKARRVSAVYWPVSSRSSVSSESPPTPENSSPPPVPHPVRMAETGSVASIGGKW